MIVENPVEFTYYKFANMCDHLEKTYAFDTKEMRTVPAMALFVLLKQHLLPHVALVEEGNTEALASMVKGDLSAIVTLCKDDGKVLRYLKLFCQLVA